MSEFTAGGSPEPAQLEAALHRQHQAEDSLRASREAFDQLVAGVRDYAIFLLDPQGRVATWNAGAERIKGYHASDIIGQHFSKFYTEDAIARGWPEEELRRATADGRFEDEGWRIRKDGSQFWANVIITALTNENGSPRGFLKITRDLTDRRRADEELRSAHADLERRVEARTAELVAANEALVNENRERRRLAEELQQRVAELRELDENRNHFLAMLAHELRNPLAPISNALQFFKLSGPASGDAAALRAIIERQLAHMTRLIDDLLDVSRVTRNHLALQCEPIDFTAVVQQAIEASRPDIERRQHHLALSLLDGPLMVNGDAVRLSQAITNLLNNAAKFTPRGGQISLRTDLEGTHVVTRIRDNGRGIPPDKREKIFEPFVQLDQSLERTESGLGIGLSLVRRIVELHDGTITAASAGLGHGSEFTLRLPLIEEN